MSGSLQETQKLIKEMEYADKSDEELAKIEMDCYMKGQASNDKVELEMLLGEVEACVAIKAKRKERKEKLKTAKEKWEQLYPQRQEKALLNLKAALSPNGQLIAAILEEEDGLTAEEIGAWCEELASLPEGELQKLLAKLKKETVIEEGKDKKYHLRQCTDVFFPEERAAWALRKVQSSARYKRYSEFAEKVLYRLDREGSALPAEDFRDEYDAEGKLDRLCDCGALACYTVDGCKLYFFPLLGDKGGEWA